MHIHLHKGTVISLLLSTIALLLVVNVLFYRSERNKIHYNNPSLNTMSDSESFFLKKPKKPLEQTTVADFPNTEDIRGVVAYKNAVWLSGDGTLIEYDPKTNQIIRYSDPQKANCDSTIAIIENYLFAPCRILSEKPTIDNPYPQYGIYKIDLNNYQVVKVFTEKDGLLDRNNYQVAADDEYVWLGTYNGLAKIDAMTDQVTFYQQELGIPGNHFSISKILVDKEYVWAMVIANAGSSGGPILYDKKTGQWKAFGPNELKMKNPSRIDLSFTSDHHAIHLIPEGIEIGYRDDGPNQVGFNLVINQYHYADKQWHIVHEKIVPYTEEEKIIKTRFPIYNPHSSKSPDGFTQVRNFPLKGRAFLSLSPLIHGKRYILTSASIDVIDSKTMLPRILIPLGENIDPGRPHATKKAFVVDNRNLIALYIQSKCAKEGCGFEAPGYVYPEIWFFDLQKEKILSKKSVIGQDIYFSLPYEWDDTSIINENGMYDVYDYNNKKMMRINTADQTVTIVKETPIPTH